MATKKILTDINLNNNAINNLKYPVALGDAVNRDFFEENLVDNFFTATWRLFVEIASIPNINEAYISNTNFSSATLIKISKTDLNSFDVSDMIDRLSIGDHFFITQINDSAHWGHFVIDNILTFTGHYNISITMVDESSVSPTAVDSEVYKIHFIPNISLATSIPSGTEIIDFGNDFISRTYTSTIVTNASILSTSVIIFSIIPSTDHPYPEESVMEGIILTAGNLDPGVGFTIYATSINGSQGQYNIYYKIIN